ncbi:unnamed protein product [Calypogeia fissa]
MAVQAQYPQNVLVPDFRTSRPRPMFGGDNRSFLAPAFGNPPYLDEFQQLQSTAAAAAAASASQLRLFTPLGVSNHCQQAAINPTLFSETDNELACNLLGGNRKRQREADDLLANSRHAILNVSDFHQSHGSGTGGLPQSSSVSTGLRLTFEEDRLNSASSPSTSGRGEVTSSLFSVVGDDLGTQLAQHKEEIDLFFKAQGEQLRQQLEEKRVRHYRALIASIEEGVSRRLREKDVEIEKAKRRNLELEERVNQATMEAQIWQTRLKNSEATVSALRSNLQQAQQAVALSRESKEGCGDSEADDAASSHHDDSADAHARAFRENKELKEQRTCRVCRCNEVSILLLPCRHLCLCKDCDGRLASCPVCKSAKNASVQVYMS